MVFNESFWLAISIVIFILLVFKQVKSFTINLLEARIKSIDSKFKEIAVISKEAEELLKEYKTLNRSSKQKVQEILDQAELEVKHLKAFAQQEISIKLKIRTENMSNKIHNEELKTLSELRLTAVKLAISSSMAIIASQKDTQFQHATIENSISEISGYI